MTRQWEKEGGKPTKADWFCKSGATGVLNIPASIVPGRAGSKVKVQEMPGRSVRQSLVTSNPFARSSCGRKFCPWVATESSAERGAIEKV